MNEQTLSAEDRKFLDQHRGGLSDSTLRAQWISSTNEHADHDGQTLATRSHEVIQQWANERGGRPATVPGSEHQGRPGVSRFIFQEQGEKNLRQIDWNDRFKSFNARDLVFVYQEHKTDGSQSNFFQLDNPNREDG